MSKFQNKYRIESARLKHWDYSTPWWYYVTIATEKHINYFGKIRNDKMYLNDLGQLCYEGWNQIPVHYNSVELDQYIIMPNHVHGILILNSIVETGKNRKHTVETGHAPSLRRQPSLSNVIGSFKSAVTRTAKKNNYDFKWQPRFWDRIIRNEKELFEIRKYIEQNPIKWEIERII